MDDKVKQRNSAIVALSDVGILTRFMSRSQRNVLVNMINTSEEAEHFVEKVLEYVDRIKTMPVTYEQDGKGQDAIVYLHYFRGSVDCWITEKDAGDPDNGDFEQTQAFGVVNLCGTGIENGELGYINIQDCIDNGLELDLYWEPKTIKDI